MAAKQVIALYSPAPQSGKSTVAHILYHIISKTRPTCILAFASPIKAMTNALLKEMGYDNALIRDKHYLGDLKEAPLTLFDGKTTARRIMQTLGTEWGREVISERIWIDILINKIILSPARTIIIDDMRFFNEKLALESLDYANIDVFCYKVIRPSIVYEATHASEGGLDNVPFDGVINNAGNIEMLEEEVKKVVGIA